MNAAIAKAMNDQICEELSSAYLYLSMSAWAESQDWPGIASWLRKQAEEEAEHAMRFFGFVGDRGGRVQLQAIAQPAGDFANLEEVFTQVLQHEHHITELIEKLYGIAMQEKDYGSLAFIQSFLTEQIEEEKTASDVLIAVRRTAGTPQGLMMLDHHLGHRE
jgi:ferritin